MDIGDIFFWTATINSWFHLLKEDHYKKIITDSLAVLSERKNIDVFAFTIMPSHIHLIWRINSLNGKETPQGSFLKYTAHEFKKLLKVSDPPGLAKYAVNASNKKYEFWQRDPLAIQLYNKQIAFQKLNYIHANPISKGWQLVNDPCNYRYSSARFYELNETEFNFLKDLRLEY